MIPLSNYLIVGAALFALGLIGFLTRRNLIVMFLSLEMMLQGVTINLVAFSHQHGNLQGQVFTLFIITVAACEAAIALALILMLYRQRQSLDVSLWQDLREPDQEATLDLDVPPAEPAEVLPKDPMLPPAGV
jgi:NADH-quinone oxidoreductase subunit K